MGQNLTNNNIVYVMINKREGVAETRYYLIKSMRNHPYKYNNLILLLIKGNSSLLPSTYGFPPQDLCIMEDYKDKLLTEAEELYNKNSK
jgi:hypothetical protein